MAKLPATSETAIGVVFLVMGLEKALRLLFALIHRWIEWRLCRVVGPQILTA
jgi:hypothetical protein